ncbi:hypothetical protein GCM10027343_14270 [Noviherbaspirillum agri]
MPNSIDLGKDLDATLLEIQAAYTAQLPERLREIGTFLQHCLSEPHIDTHFQQLLMRLHKLAGSAGTFGFAELGQRATELEILLDSYLKGMSRGGDDSGDVSGDGAGAFADIAAGVRDMLASAGDQNSSQLAPQDAL